MFWGFEMGRRQRKDMILRAPAENERVDFVMPAWIAGIQVCMDASGDIHVSLDSSIPCWNDGASTAAAKF
jgi:hypothetical protein